VTAHIAVIGASLAGARAAEALRRQAFAGRITVVGAEGEFPPVDRPPLSKKALAGDAERPLDLVRVQEALDVDLLLGRTAVQLDVAGRRVRLDDGTELGYDGLLVATGAEARRLPGADDRTNVHVLRSARDAVRLRTGLTRCRRVVVIGAGVLGCEIAATCRGLGLEVDVIDMVEQPMLRVVGPDMAPAIGDLHRGKGVRFHLGRQVLGLQGTPEVTGVLLDGPLGGTELVPADVVVVAIGAVPATAWLIGSGLELADGVVCDATGMAAGSGDTVAAAGDVARWFHPLFGATIRVEHWTNAVSQGQAAAQSLLAAFTGQGTAVPYTALPYFWSDQYGWKLQVIGIVGDETKLEEGTVEAGRFVVSYQSGGRLVGALCVNWPNRVGRWRSQIEEAAV
jgi:3-phenylpropionate/trans-cinnamate dioxygenase ferredoxin reductase subunit